MFKIKQDTAPAAFQTIFEKYLIVILQNLVKVTRYYLSNQIKFAVSSKSKALEQTFKSRKKTWHILMALKNLCLENEIIYFRICGRKLKHKN